MSGDDRPAHYRDLDAVLPTAWWMLGWGVGDPKADFHIAQVATVDGAGRPTLRSMVLRGVDRDARAIRFHTDHRSGKVGELRTRGEIAALLYDRDEKV